MEGREIKIYPTFQRSLDFGIIVIMHKISSPTKKKILLLLLGGASLGLTHSPKSQIRILKQISSEWRKINRNHLIRNLNELYNYGYISWKEKADGSCEVVITKRGASHAKLLDIENLSIKRPNIWDGKWRVVFFDIPEKKKKARNALREKLRDLGFCEMQKSIFAFPYECQDEINFIITLFEIKPYVQYAEMTNMTNEITMRKIFKLL